MSESLTDKLTRHGMAAASSHVYGGEADLLFAACARIAELEAAIDKAIKHADGNGMKDWPVFRTLRKVMKSK